MNWQDEKMLMIRFAFWLLLVSFRAQAADLWTYWIEPCSEAKATDSNCKKDDPELARWALEAWQKSGAGALILKPATQEQSARLRIHWVTGRSQLYGEARPFAFEGKRGADVYVLPSIARAGEDPLLRETVVYLTCLHETGHALGLAHTDAFADIMYTFQFGGNIAEYFGRFRRQLKTRPDIARTNAISEADRAALVAALR